MQYSSRANPFIASHTAPCSLGQARPGLLATASQIIPFVSYASTAGVVCVMQRGGVLLRPRRAEVFCWSLRWLAVPRGGADRRPGGPGYTSASETGRYFPWDGNRTNRTETCIPIEETGITGGGGQLALD